MSSLRFYTDSHVPKQVAIQLRERGIDIIRCQEIGYADATDYEHLEKATSEFRMVITGDSDFPRLNSQWNEVGRFHAGILYFQPNQQGDTGAIVNSATFLSQAVEIGAATLEDDVYNRIVYVERRS